MKRRKFSKEFKLNVLSELDSFEEAYKTIREHVKLYNGKRLHSRIGYMPPDEFEEKEVLNRR